MPEIGTVRMRYPGNDPENGPAFPHRWDGQRWVCAEHKWVEEGDSYEVWSCCRRCGEYKRSPA